MSENVNSSLLVSKKKEGVEARKRKLSFNDENHNPSNEPKLIKNCLKLSNVQILKELCKPNFSSPNSSKQSTDVTPIQECSNLYSSATGTDANSDTSSLGVPIPSERVSSTPEGRLPEKPSPAHSTPVCEASTNANSETSSGVPISSGLISSTPVGRHPEKQSPALLTPASEASTNANSETSSSVVSMSSEGSSSTPVGKFPKELSRLLLTPASEASSSLIDTSVISSVCYSSINADWVKTQLLKCRKGKSVLRFYEKNNYLNKDKKKILYTLIVENQLEEDPGLIISREKFQQMAKAISTCFSSECQEDYYMASRVSESGKSIPAKGKLFNKYVNMKRNFRKEGLIASCSKRSKESDDDDNDDVDDSAGGATNTALCYLQNHEDLKDQKLLDCFESTLVVRRQIFKKKKLDLKNYFQLYPAYLQRIGYRLIDLDYSILFPEKLNCMFDKWPETERKLLSAAEQDSKRDTESAKLLSKFNIILADTDPASRDPTALTLSALHFIAVSMPKIPVARNWKPSNREATKGFVLHIEEGQDIDEELAERSNIRKKYKLPTTPLPLILGDVKTNATYFVYINGFYLQCASLIKAVDLSYKIYSILDLPFAPDVAQAWCFLHKYIYGSELIIHPGVETLIHRLSQLLT